MPLDPDLPPISPVALRFFRRIVRSYFRRHFRSVMARGLDHADTLQHMRGPLIVYANHSSWWDPMTLVFLAETLLPGRRHYAPMDAAALHRYPILRKLGIFPVETATARGAAQFLRTSQAILRNGGVLWITPQGRFADTREGALGFKPGLGALAVRMRGVPLLPLAIEYTFWDERLPEALFEFGAPVQVQTAVDADAATEGLEATLASVMDSLRTASMARDDAAFRVLLTGGRGTGGMYSLLRRARSRARGGREAPDHGRRKD